VISRAKPGTAGTRISSSYPNLMSVIGSFGRNSPETP
jgi:hypothetical protein